MAVIKEHRSESKAEFVNTANKIYVQTINFIARMSNRYSRILAGPTSQLATEVLDNAEKANSIFPSDSTRKELREKHLLEARASLMALDVHLQHCYDVMMMNPEGCFDRKNGKGIGSARAKRKLDDMVQAIGDLIDLENGLLTGVLKSDKSRK